MCLIVVIALLLLPRMWASVCVCVLYIIMLARVHRPLEGHKVIENWVSCVPISTVLHVSLSLSERVCVCVFVRLRVCRCVHALL